MLLKQILFKQIPLENLYSIRLFIIDASIYVIACHVVPTMYGIACVVGLDQALSLAPV